MNEPSEACLESLTNRDSEFWSKMENYTFELFLSIESIDHSKTKAYSPQTNGIYERFHKTMKEEFYDSAFRKKIYSGIEELQRDVDEWLDYYNNHQPHSGKFCYGKTPMQTFLDARHIALEKSNELVYHQNPSDSHNLNDNQITNSLSSVRLNLD